MSSPLISHVVVIGAGLMGSGIAQVSAAAGFQVTLVDLDEKLLAKSRASIENSLQRVARKQFNNDGAKMSEFVRCTLSRIQSTTNLEAIVKSADLVIEAIVENLEKKQKLFSHIDKLAKPSAIFASNTSSLPISQIAKTSARLDRFCGLHFFNPVAVMKLLEIIRIPETSDATYATVLAFGKKIGKICVTCKDTPGFIVNRLLNPYMAEAINMLERGDATAEDIDIAMKLGAGYPMGPFELTDLVGLDTARSVREFYHKQFPDNPQYKPSSIIDQKVREGKLGVKSGEGFYKYY